MKRRSSLTLLSALLGAALATPHRAQSSEGIEEIVVTAQRREQDLQDVAIAVSAFSGENLRERGIVQSNRIGAQIPNLAIGTNGGPDGTPSVVIRGVGLSDFSDANSGPIGIYVDDVYLKALRAQNFALFDLERLEVLRGPQGTLFGRNTTGGAVQYHSRKPGRDPEARVTVEAASDATYTGEVAMAGALGTNVAGRIAARYVDSDGWMSNSWLDETNDYEKLSWRGTLAFDPTEELSILLKYEYGRSDGNSFPVKGRGLLDPLDGSTCTAGRVDAYQCANALGYVEGDDDLLRARNDFEDRTETDYRSGLLRLDWQLSDAITLTSISAWVGVDTHQGEDSDGSPAGILNVILDSEGEQVSQELRLAGASAGVNWVTGVYWLDDHNEGTPFFALFPELVPLAEAGYLDDSTAAAVGSFTSLYDQDTTSAAAFAHLEYALTETLDLTVGGRYTDEQVDAELMTLATFPAYPVAPGVQVPLADFPVVTMDDDIGDSNVSWKIGLDFSPREDLMVYASAGTGFTAGGFNTTAVIEQFQAVPFDSEEIIAWEFGLKSRAFDERLQVNAALFRYDYDDMQVFTDIVTSSGVSGRLVQNAASGEMQGAELELIALPAQGLTVQFTAGYVDSELSDFSTQTFDPAAGAVVTVDLSGNTTALTPEWNCSALVRYAWAMAGGEASAQLAWSWQDSVFFSTDNTPGVAQDAYGLLDARIAWDAPQDRWQLALWGRNLLDEDYRSYSSNLAPFGLYQDYGPQPRSIGVTATMNL
jgi:iron complex outermembrane receptor protein